VRLVNLIESQDLTFEEYVNKLPKEIVDKLKELKQNPIYHPEIFLYTHMKQVFNNTKKRGKDFAIAAIFHDLGKIDTLSYDDKGRPHFLGHENTSMKYLDKYLHLFPVENKELVYELVKNHMKAEHYPVMRAGHKKTFEGHPYFKHIMDFHRDDVKREKE